MNLVSNFVGSISPNMFGENTQSITPNFDLNDKTFSDLLQKQIDKELAQNKPNFIETLGLPTGFNIADFENVGTGINNFGVNNMGVNDMGVNTTAENKLDAIKPVNAYEKSDINLKNPKDISTSELLMFFNSLFDSKPTMTNNSSTGLFDFERKVAANSYGKYSKNVVTDLSEFVSGALKHS